MNSFCPEVLDNLRIGHEVIANIREIGEGKGKQDLFADKSPDILEKLRQIAMIESTESSNRLEGVTVPRTVLEKIVKYNKEPFIGNRSEGEIAGYKGVLQTVHERHEFIDLTNNIILHSIVICFDMWQAAMLETGRRQTTALQREDQTAAHLFVFSLRLLGRYRMRWRPCIKLILKPAKATSTLSY